MWKKAVTWFSQALSHIPDKYDTYQICVSHILKEPENLQFVPNQNKSQEMSEKALYSCIYILQDVHDCYRTQEMGEIAIDRYPYGWKHFPNKYKHPVQVSL